MSDHNKVQNGGYDPNAANANGANGYPPPPVHSAILPPNMPSMPAYQAAYQPPPYAAHDAFTTSTTTTPYPPSTAPSAPYPGQYQTASHPPPPPHHYPPPQYPPPHGGGAYPGGYQASQPGGMTGMGSGSAGQTPQYVTHQHIYNQPGPQQMINKPQVPTHHNDDHGCCYTCIRGICCCWGACVATCIAGCCACCCGGSDHANHSEYQPFIITDSIQVVEDDDCCSSSDCCCWGSLLGCLFCCCKD